jgi:hypothetical protein
LPTHQDTGEKTSHINQEDPRPNKADKHEPRPTQGPPKAIAYENPRNDPATNDASDLTEVTDAPKSHPCGPSISRDELKSTLDELFDKIISNSEQRTATLSERIGTIQQQVSRSDIEVSNLFTRLQNLFRKHDRETQKALVLVIQNQDVAAGHSELVTNMHHRLLHVMEQVRGRLDSIDSRLQRLESRKQQPPRLAARNAFAASHSSEEGPPDLRQHPAFRRGQAIVEESAVYSDSTTGNDTPPPESEYPRAAQEGIPRSDASVSDDAWKMSMAHTPSMAAPMMPQVMHGEAMGYHYPSSPPMPGQEDPHLFPPPGLFPGMQMSAGPYANEQWFNEASQYRPEQEDSTSRYRGRRS